MLEKLKNLNMDRMLDTEEAVVLSAFARTLEDEYDHLGLKIPPAISKAILTLRTEIGRRTHAEKMNQVDALQRELESYKTVGEKKNEAQRKLAELQKELGLSSSAAKAR